MRRRQQKNGSAALRRVAGALLLWAGVASGVCAAQERTAVGVTAGLSSQRKGDSDQPYLGPGFGGSAVGGVVFVDGQVAGRVSLGGEVSLAADIEGRQQQRASGGSNDLRSRHHDTIVSAVAKLYALDAPRGQVAAVFGAGIGWRQTARTGTFRSDVPPFATSAVEQQLSNAAYLTTVGFDGALSISSRAALLWAGRLHLLRDDDRDASGVVRRGVGSTVFRFGGGARFRF